MIRAWAELGAALDSHDDPRLRRQLIRWLIQLNRPPNEYVATVISAGLSDPDWEVRMSTMFAAGRLNLFRLRSLVNRLTIPSGSGIGLDRVDRDTLVAARYVIVAHLDGMLAPEQFDTTVAAIPGVTSDLARAVLGLPVAHPTRATLWIASFTTPADTETEPHPHATLPPGVQRTGSQYYLGDTGIELLWIAPIPHWLGDEDTALPSLNPIRHVAPETGFFIARYPLPDSSSTNDLQSAPQYRTFTMTEARDQCQHLSQRSGARVAIPTDDQWEMAARGPDGRRFPWGNGVEEAALLQASPWGIEHAIGVIPQWVTHHTHPATMGGRWRHMRCAARQSAQPEERAALRPVVPF